MTSADSPLAAFAFDEMLGWWEAELLVLLWGERLPARIDAPAAGPSPRQVETLRAVLAYPVDLRGRVGEALLAHYRDEWHGVTLSVGPGPELRSADEAWAAMSAVTLSIPAYRSDTDGVVFEFHMDSRWDEDHGLCVLVRDWIVFRVAGQAAAPAIRVRLEHIETGPVTWYLPYRISDQRLVRVGLSQVAGQWRFFWQVSPGTRRETMKERR